MGSLYLQCTSHHHGGDTINPDPITTLINHYVYGPETTPVPQSIEVRRHVWRVERQARFDELGLPRGLGGVA